MNILLSNDDGYQAEGILFLNKYFKERGHNVFLVAPRYEQSGKSHSLSFQDSIRLYEHFDNVWVLEGTPADCVNLAILGIIPVKPDLVISGINHGYNVGMDIIFSGTVAAARQAAILGVPSIAISSAVSHSKEVEIGLDTLHINYEIIEHFFDNNFESLVQASSCEHIININFPNIETEKLQGALQTSIYRKERFYDELISFKSPHQGTYYWIKGNLHELSEIPTNYDVSAVNNGYISVSTIELFVREKTLPLNLKS